MADKRAVYNRSVMGKRLAVFIKKLCEMATAAYTPGLQPEAQKGPGWTMTWQPGTDPTILVTFTDQTFRAVAEKTLVQALEHTTEAKGNDLIVTP